MFRCARRHRGSETSAAANERIGPRKDAVRDAIYVWFVYHGPRTCKEVSREMRIGYTTVSARISELKASGQLVPTGARREGAAVLMAQTAEERQQGNLF